MFARILRSHLFICLKRYSQYNVISTSMNCRMRCKKLFKKFSKNTTANNLYFHAFYKSYFLIFHIQLLNLQALDIPQ